MADSPRLTPIQWLICVIAAIGFAFDTYTLLMQPLILRPALLELLNAPPNTPTFNLWRGLLFFIPAIVGGVFGLFGGYLTDRLGRRRILTWSILLYAISAFASGYSTSIWMLLVLRCLSFVGVCVEFVAAVAWLAELFPEPAQRERVLGYTQFFSSFGGIMVAYVNYWVVARVAADPTFFPAIVLPSWLGSLGQVNDPHAAWRYTMMSGILPALPLIVIRPFLPESPAWQAKRQAGTLKRPAIGQLFAPDLRRTTIVTTLMFACSFGAAFGAIQQIPQIVPVVPEVKSAVAEKTKGLAKPQAAKVTGEIIQATGAHVTKTQEWGGLLGRLVLAFLVTVAVSQRRLIRTFLYPGLVLLPLTFGYLVHRSQSALEIGIFLVGFFTVAQFSFWGNYLPRVFPLHLRGTGESFAANIGGRMIGTSFAMLTTQLAFWLPMKTGDAPPAIADATKMAAAAAIVGTFAYVVNIILSFWLPEPQHAELPE
jgi:MFS family permease